MLIGTNVRRLIHVLSLSEEQLDAMTMDERLQVDTLRRKAIQKMRLAKRVAQRAGGCGSSSSVRELGHALGDAQAAKPPMAVDVEAAKRESDRQLMPPPPSYVRKCPSQ